MDLKLRPMEEKDLQVTFDWRNDPEVLKHAQTSNPISFNEHEAVFKFNNAVKLVFEYNGDPAGYVSVTRDPDDSIGEWSFHMGSKYRGKGLAEIMLKAALYYLAKEEGYTGLTSAVLKHNNISIHLHKKLGFELTGTKNNFNEYYLDL